MAAPGGARIDLAPDALEAQVEVAMQQLKAHPPPVRTRGWAAGAVCAASTCGLAPTHAFHAWSVEYLKKLVREWLKLDERAYVF